jgi:thiamine monophosphate synthase
VSAAALRALTWRRRQIFLVAGDAALARRVKADGVHLPQYQLRGGRPAGLKIVTAACHTRAALARAAAVGVDLALVSPVFATRSHAGAPALGPHRFARLIRGAAVPVAALGGITPQTAKRLRPLNVAGVAAIDGLSGSS